MVAVILCWTLGWGVLLPGSGAGRCPGFVMAAGPAKSLPAFITPKGCKIALTPMPSVEN